MNWPMLALLTIAAARATHLVADDSWPFGFLREWLLKKKFYELAHGFSCTFCVSVHAGFWSAVLASYAGWVPVDGWGDWPVFMVTWFAVAQLIILLEGLVEALMGGE